ncbi:DUF1598 domain-containing protein [Aeoliella mucimassa]|uniref:DUF1598 domain-containing protein n=1 Tax=Aeoliella mucimassa TaxID=2527972 RepID=A0A518ASM2_9BACT|nr:DUF1598 domain-containing protein [Aeoliella mucimassa]QDU57715.1 hypothetical protein Pan181_39370 [Aeoliella mucimassa]
MDLRIFQGISRKFFTAVAVVLAITLSSTSLAQFGGGGGFGGGGFGGGGGGFGGGGGGFGGGGFGGGTSGGNQNGSRAGGVMVDADGVMHRELINDPTGELTRARIEGAMARLEGDLTKVSEMRKVSLTRLEQAIAKKIAAGSGPDEVMKNLAGLTRIEYVFCYPETGDIVVAGPAEPWVEDLDGRMRGLNTGRPVVELQDMITALRAFPAQSGGKAPLMYCSIDPTEEGLQRMQQFLAQFGRSATPNDTQFIVNKLQEAMGKQVITIGGIPATTHFAQVMVEADYRMKLMGINLEQPPIRLKSYVDRARPGAVSRNAMERWYFVPDYQCVRAAEDSLAMQIVGQGVKLVGENEVISMHGGRATSGRVNAASQQYTAAFTKAYPELAEQSPVFAQLRNCIDMAVAAAFIQQHDLYSKAGWSMSLFGSEEQYPVETLNAPAEVATAVNAIWKGRTLMTPIGGGVEVRPTKALESENLLKDEDGSVASQRKQLDLNTLGPDQWWWD